jgi:hypothetical protein
LFRRATKADAKEVAIGKHEPWGLRGINFTPDEKRLYAFGNDNRIHTWDLKTHKELPIPKS